MSLQTFFKEVKKLNLTTDQYLKIIDLGCDLSCSTREQATKDAIEIINR